MKDSREIWAVLPVKDFALAKSRLAPRCSPEFRRRLAAAMMEDVLNALTEASGLAGIVLVTADPDAVELARKFGSRVRISEEAARDGHTGAVMAAARRISDEGHRGMLAVPADIPGITAREVAELLACRGKAHSFSIVPAHDRRGSNAILMTPPDAMPLAFGTDSFMPHLETARRFGIEPKILPMPGIGLDIDHPEDLVKFLRTSSSQGKTWSFLRREAHSMSHA